MSQMASFKNRSILVTGGSRGIAAAIALDLVKRGANVCVSYCADADAAAGKDGAIGDLLAAADAESGSLATIDQDLSQPAAGKQLAEAALAKVGAIDSLVLSASIQIEKPLSEQTAQDLDLQYRMNLTNNIEILNACLPQMARAGFGRVVSIGSVQDVAPSKRIPIYAMTKAAMSNLIANLAVEYAPNGITLNTVAPGLIHTDRNEKRRVDPGAWESITANANPIGRAGLPEEIAASTAHLLSTEAGFVTGATLYATGGAHLPRGDDPTKP